MAFDGVVICYIQQSCDFFSAGFPNSEQREQHVSKHDHAYRYTIKGCQMAAFGYTTAKDLDWHMADYYRLSVEEEVQFLSEFPARALSKSLINSPSLTPSPKPAVIPTPNLVLKYRRTPFPVKGMREGLCKITRPQETRKFI